MSRATALELVDNGGCPALVILGKGIRVLPGQLCPSPVSSSSDPEEEEEDHESKLAQGNSRTLELR